MTTSVFALYFEEPWLPFHIVRHVPGSGQWDTVHAFDYAPRVVEGETLRPFRPYGSYASTRDAVLTARGDRSQLARVDPAGGTLGIVRWTEEPAFPTAAFWEDYAAFRMSLPSSRSDEEQARQLAEARAAALGPLPFVGRLFGDAEGRAWVSVYPPDYRHPERYRVFDPAGEWLGWVDVPPRTEILDIGSDVVLAIQRDPLDVEAVALLPLLAPG